MNELEKLYIERLERKILTEGVSNEFLVSLLKLCEAYLQLTRVKKYSDEINKSTQGIRKYHSDKIVKICNYQLIINNN